MERISRRLSMLTSDKLMNQNEVHQRTIHGLEQDLRIVKHDLDIAKKD